jgi:hypothetical protein
MEKTTTGFALGLFGILLILEAVAPRPRSLPLRPEKKWPAPLPPPLGWQEFAELAVSATIH